MEHINFNGRIYLLNEPIVEAANRGLRYGDGLFETMKVLEGKIIYETDHLERLWRGLQVLQFDLPKHFTKGTLIRSIKQLIEKNNCIPAARIRLNVFRGSGGLYDAVNHFPNYVVEAMPLTAMETINSNGLVLGIYEEIAKSCDILSNIKHNNYLGYAMAALKAKKEKWNDAIVLNQFGRIADSTIANIFIVKNNEIFTPALSEGCVAGVIRKNLIDFLLQNNWIIKDEPISKELLFDADEVFLTNSIYNIRWVQRVNNVSYGNAVTQKIYKDFTSTIH